MQQGTNSASMEQVRMIDVLHMQSVSEHSSLDHANSTECLEGTTCQKNEAQRFSTSSLSQILCLCTKCTAVNKDMGILLNHVRKYEINRNK